MPRKKKPTGAAAIPVFEGEEEVTQTTAVGKRQRQRTPRKPKSNRDGEKAVSELPRGD